MARNVLGYLIFLLQVIFIACQKVYNCPLGWESFESHCYRFEFGESHSYQDANSACWVKGSALVSVNKRLEFDFIANWLLRHDLYNKYGWYTSGEYSMGLIKWNGDGSYTNDTSAYFPGSLLEENTKQKYIIYAYSDATQTYKWERVAGDVKRKYICEIPLKEVSRIVQMNRGFDYGLPLTPYDRLEMGPKIVLHPQNVIVIGDSSLVALECAARGKPQPQHTWFQQVASTWIELSVASDNRYTFSNGRYSIENPLETKDSGTYRCKMENSYGSLISVPVSLSFGRLDQFSPNTPGPVEATLYQGTFLQCNPPSAKPALTYQWYKDNIFNFIRPELQTYQFLSSNGNLYFSEVQDYDSGFYHCVVTLTGRPGDQISSVQPPSRTSKGIQLKIKGAPSSEYGPIIHNDFIAVFPRPALVGQDIRLECFAYGRMPLIYRWTRSDAPLPQGYELFDSNRILTIHNAKMEDEGNYTCHVHRATGSVAAAKSIYLVIEANPTFIIPLQDMHADESSELIWRCEVQAKPWATYTWYKNSLPLTNVPGEVEIRENVLWIHRLDKTRDSGMYQCIATNAFGTATSGAQLRVLSFTPNFAKNPLSPEILAGDGGNVTIDCAPEAAPVPDITWYQNGNDLGLIPGRDGRVRMTIEGHLVITKVSSADQGFYKCLAKNINGESEMTSSLTVASDLTFSRAPVDAIADVNQTHFFYCEASYNYEVFDLVYVWKFNGRIINMNQDPFYRTSTNIPGSRGLYIINSQFKHSGTYECVAQTRLTEISASAQLTVRGPPGEPVGVYADNVGRNSTSIRLYWTWSTASDHRFPIAYYNIEARTNYDPEWRVTETNIPSEITLLQSAQYPDRRSYLVQNLSPNTAYSFRLRAGNIPFGAGDPSLPTSFYMIPPDEPKTPPENIGGGGGSEGTLTITWDPLGRADEAGPGFGYEVFWRLLNMTKWSNQRVGNVTKHTVTVGKEMYFLLYEVKIRAYNDIGNGPESPVNEIYSAEGVPLVQVKNVRGYAINGTSAMITWDALPDGRDIVKGRVIGYQIDYFDKDFQRGVADSLYVFEHVNHGVVIGLVPHHHYWFNVEVLNSAGKGTPSERFLIPVDEYAPSNYPEIVWVYSHGPHSVQVKWRGIKTIEFLEATLLGYKLKWWKATDDIRTATELIVDKIFEAVIDGIQKNNVYKLRIMGINRGGDGKNSPTVYFTLGGEVAFDAEIAEQVLVGYNGGKTLHNQIFSMALVTLCGIMTRVWISIKLLI